jgi:hypothetical protein
MCDAGYMAGYLNRQIVQLLSTQGVPDSVFLDMQVPASSACLPCCPLHLLQLRALPSSTAQFRHVLAKYACMCVSRCCRW